MYDALHPNNPNNDSGEQRDDMKKAFGDFVGDLLIKRDFVALAEYTGQAEGEFMDWFMDNVEDGKYRTACQQWIEGDSMWVTTTAHEIADDYFDYLEMTR